MENTTDLIPRILRDVDDGVLPRIFVLKHL